MTKCLPPIGLILLVLTGGPVFAWGPEGHQLVGSIADQLLKPNAKSQVAQILGFDLQTAAVWPDCVRGVEHRDGSTGFHYKGDGRFPECAPFEGPPGVEKKRMENYAERNWTTCFYRKDHGCHETYHFADVTIQRDHYDRKLVGTGAHDIVSAINVAIGVLRDKPVKQDVPANEKPIDIADKKEALFLLAHFVGDIHQPLHVGSVYLAANGALVDPDTNGNDKKTHTSGGNSIGDQGTNLHHEWDAIPAALGVTASKTVVDTARGIPPTPDPIETWAAAWATETIMKAHDPLLDGITYAGPSGHWKAVFTDRAKYWEAADSVKADQLPKAGARLAQVLNYIWP